MNYLKLSSNNLENANQSEIEEWKFCHELGHGIVAYVFDNYMYCFQKITFKVGEGDQKQIHPNDIGYTIACPTATADLAVQQDSQKAVLVDGLYLLSGIAGATFLGEKNSTTTEAINTNNFESVLDLRGADGDFEIIKRGNRLYGWFLNKKGYNPRQRIELHCKLIQILKESFSNPEILPVGRTLMEKLKKERELFPEDFHKAFNEKLKQQIYDDITVKISVIEFGQIT